MPRGFVASRCQGLYDPFARAGASGRVGAGAGAGQSPLQPPRWAQRGARGGYKISI